MTSHGKPPHNSSAQTCETKTDEHVEEDDEEYEEVEELVVLRLPAFAGAVATSIKNARCTLSDFNTARPVLTFDSGLAFEGAWDARPPVQTRAVIGLANSNSAAANAQFAGTFAPTLSERLRVDARVVTSTEEQRRQNAEQQQQPRQQWAVTGTATPVRTITFLQSEAAMVSHQIATAASGGDDEADAVAGDGADSASRS